MAARVCIVANPTSADVTVGATVAKAGRLTNLTLDDSTVTAYAGFVDAGCGIIRASVNKEDVRKNIGFLFEHLNQDIVGGRPA
jgi:hypothetical protein